MLEWRSLPHKSPEDLWGATLLSVISRQSLMGYPYSVGVAHKRWTQQPWKFMGGGYPTKSVSAWRARASQPIRAEA